MSKENPIETVGVEQKHRARILRGIGRALSWIALIWVVWTLRSAWPDVRHSIVKLQWSTFSIGMALLLFSAYISAVWFDRVVALIAPGRLSRRSLLHLFFASQVLRHLPGRIWGISYQVAQTRKSVEVSQWVGINIVFTLASVYFGVACALSVWAFSFGAQTMLLSVFVLLSMYFAGWSALPWRWLGKGIRVVSFRSAERIDSILDRLPTRRGGAAFQFLILGILVWGSYILGWICLGHAFNSSLTIFDTLQLWSRYLLAWFFGYISVIAPSGVGVREASFSMLSGDFDKALVAYYLVMARFTLLICDLFWGLVFVRSGSPSADKPKERRV
jgi:hypothetical protein